MCFSFSYSQELTNAFNNLVLETAATEFQRRFHISADQVESHPQSINRPVSTYLMLPKRWNDLASYSFFFSSAPSWRRRLWSLLGASSKSNPYGMFKKLTRVKCVVSLYWWFPNIFRQPSKKLKDCLQAGLCKLLQMGERFSLTITRK